ncbi:MAG: hypothetical protein V1726_02055 [Methanobacteriota archaeon]
MNMKLIQRLSCLTILSILLLSSFSVSGKRVTQPKTTLSTTDLVDFDPLVETIQVTVTIKEIRALDDFGKLKEPSFYVKLIINGEEFTSPTWKNSKHITPYWSTSVVVPKDTEWVQMKIQLWEEKPLLDKICDISADEQYTTGTNDTDAEIWYSLKTGHWAYDDWAFYWFEDEFDDENYTSPGYMPFIDPLFFDPSGYGRLNGCDDGSIYQNERDCELWFDITQIDPDGDGIPYWIETNIYNTSPVVNDSLFDPNGDGIPMSWDFKWGYDPFAYDNHSTIDLEHDGLDNYEEYLMSQWGSDPFRKDLFIEMDQMMAGPNGEPASIFPDGAKELLYTAYDRQNVVYHLDDGSWGDEGGSEMIPFDNQTEMSWGHGSSELMQIYDDYFLHGNESNWRRGVFHYGVVIYQCNVANGNAFGNDRFQVSSNGLEQKAETRILKLFNPFNVRDVVYASAYMHESGHTLGFVSPGVDVQTGKYPYQLDWWRWLPYKSVMNYGWMYKMVDYSDGSRGRHDSDDWSLLDLEFFQRDFPWFHH